MKMISQKRLKKTIHYNPETGLFTRIIRSKYKNNTGLVKTGVSSQGYLRLTVEGKRHYAHRLAFLYMNGSMPKEQVDHIDHDRTNNSWSNLRSVSPAENNKNMSIRSDNSSGVHGVDWKERDNRWRARIYVDGKESHLGYFAEFSDAVNARKNAEALYGYHKNHGYPLHEVSKFLNAVEQTVA